ncbi:MAG: hypothetical protein R2883_00675 [Caldisericia bacterium]
MQGGFFEIIHQRYLVGPLFQVRNYRMGVLSRIGGLYKAIAHDWYLPLMFTSLPFVGGTNLHIS